MVGVVVDQNASHPPFSSFGQFCLIARDVNIGAMTCELSIVPISTALWRADSALLLLLLSPPFVDWSLLLDMILSLLTSSMMIDSAKLFIVLLPSLLMKFAIRGAARLLC